MAAYRFSFTIAHIWNHFRRTQTHSHTDKRKQIKKTQPNEKIDIRLDRIRFRRFWRFTEFIHFRFDEQVSLSAETKKATKPTAASRPEKSDERKKIKFILAFSAETFLEHCESHNRTLIYS